MCLKVSDSVDDVGPFVWHFNHFTDDTQQHGTYDLALVELSLTTRSGKGEYYYCTIVGIISNVSCYERLHSLITIQLQAQDNRLEVNQLVQPVMHFSVIYNVVKFIFITGISNVLTDTEHKSSSPVLLLADRTSRRESTRVSWINVAPPIGHETQVH